MERIDPQQIANVLLASAGWARVGLTAPDERLREQSAKELATAICEALDPPQEPDRNQMALPL